ncbi:MAG: bacteriocin [Bacteroidales bacterium]|nr:bacteriocin [Bacteroidales bacterium]
MKTKKDLEPLSKKEMNNVTGGWRLFGWDYKYENQKMATGNGSTDPTGSFGSYYVFGIERKTGLNVTHMDN